MRSPSHRLLLLLVTACIFSSCGSVPSVERHRRVLVIGVDGVRSDCLRKASTPFLDQLIKNGVVSWDAHAGGGRDEGDPTQQATSSGPGWGSILTGVWRDRHGIVDNSFEGSDLQRYPHFFQRVRAAQPEAYLASIVHWSPINEFLLHPFPGLASFALEPSGDLEVEHAAVDQLERENPDVLFLHFDDVDHAGHAHGYGPFIAEYVAAIEQVDRNIGGVLTALWSRERYEQEDWLVLVTTDHGGIGTGHGGQSIEERTIWIIAHGGGLEPGVVTPGPGHTVIARSALEHLGIECADEWALADRAAFGR